MGVPKLTKFGKSPKPLKNYIAYKSTEGEEPMDSEKYTYQIAWSEEDQEYVATVAEFPSLSWLDKDRRRAEDGLIDLVSEVIEDMTSAGESVPTPLGQRNFSGKFNVRTTPTLHRLLVTKASFEGVSLNALINQKLASA